MKKQSVLLLLAGLLGWQLAMAEKAIAPEVLEAVENVIPGMKPDRVNPAPVPGLYELVYGPHIVYVTADGRYMVRGDVVDLKKRENLTETKRKEARLTAINDLGEDSMIIFAPEAAKYSVTVFTDIECGYCRRLHQQMADYNRLGITIRYLAFPRAGVPSDTYDQMVSVWCADDPQQAMTAAKAGKRVEPKQCTNPVRKQYELGQAVGVRGTPTMILEDGEVLPGYVPPQQLVQMLESPKSAGLSR
ncbi:MAG: DsbC family protein [Gammaproteobacteria bacterium]|nr:DsbC family protein [Gammaproteobacteria bacterium]